MWNIGTFPFLSFFFVNAPYKSENFTNLFLQCLNFRLATTTDSSNLCSVIKSKPY